MGIGSRIIPAFSAQAKGRIERSWDTLQDRLVAEFGLYEIKTMSEATQYLNQKFLVAYMNKQNY